MSCWSCTPTQRTVCYLPVPSFPEFLVKSSASSGQETLVWKGLANPEIEGGFPPWGGGRVLGAHCPPALPSLFQLACVICLLFYV